MQPFIWTAEHCQALREYRARGLSYGEIARRLNSKFGTAYTRSAALGRGVRMGLSSPGRPSKGARRLSKLKLPKRPKRPGVAKPRQERSAAEFAPASAPLGPKPVTLRCVGIKPRLISLIELRPNDCRYPYGGDKDGEAIAFCGHPKSPGSSYCAPHFHLTRGDGVPSERAPGPVMLRLVEAA